MNEREKMKGDQKKAQNLISVIRQPWDWMDCPRQLFQRQNPTRFPTPIHLFSRTKKTWGGSALLQIRETNRDREAISNSKYVHAES